MPKTTETNEAVGRLVLPASMAALESRAEGERPELISGYGAVFYRLGDDASQYRADVDLVERIMPGAFSEFVEDRSRECLCSLDHDDRQLLGRRSSGTLSMSIDDRGLRYSVPYDAADPDHQRVAAKIRRGDIFGSSLRFLAHEERWLRDQDTGMIVREVLAADVFQIGPVTDPAYEGTSAEVRSSAVPDGGWATLQHRKAAFLAAEELGRESLLIEIDRWIDEVDQVLRD